ncbi:hypothetical protein ARMGADRAFT_1069626 [Armillaria gallica]|uniref:eIF3a PCI domain-containing protein n=1 Tax=Armillaria gallica TaxID=47427 RepID=A0A2H3E6M9_ARMGA|nr:hypothetical protein ARMGADRAFT_1069626 [Armillaria gallica]
MQVAVDNLDASETPESISLGAVSDDQSKDRTDRALVRGEIAVICPASIQILSSAPVQGRLSSSLQDTSYSHQPHSINLSDSDTLQNHLDAQFAQLELELWQEAFRSAEDIRNLSTIIKTAPRPAMMANYYEKLTKIFLVSGNALYHPVAWARYYALLALLFPWVDILRSTMR